MDEKNDLLFNKRLLSEFLAEHEAKVLVAINDYDPDEINMMSTDELANLFLETYTIQLPVIREDKIILHSKDVRANRRDALADVVLWGWRRLYEYEIPYKGNGMFFDYQPSQYALSPPLGKVIPSKVLVIFEGQFYEKQDSGLISRYAMPLKRIFDPYEQPEWNIFAFDPEKELEEIRAQFGENLSAIKQHLLWMAEDVAEFKELLDKKFQHRIRVRKRKLLQQDKSLILAPYETPNTNRVNNDAFDVALSFAGEDRPYVEQVAAYLKDHGVKVFYDGFEQATLWGKNLYTHLSTVYKDKARYTIVFLSKHYKKKLWTKHELESAQARAFAESSEYILPVRFDDTEIPGIQITTGYVDLRGMQPEALGNLILTKLSASPSSLFEILVSQGNRSKTRNGETGPWQNLHQMRILVRSGRKVEVDIAKAERSEEKDVLEIFVLFGGHSYIIPNMQEKLIDFTKFPFMDWLICEKVSGGLNCNVNGRRLILCFPQLSDLLWLNNEFYTPPQLQQGPRSNTSDPADVYGFGFRLSEP